jgi:hypothetical protein
MPLCCTENEGEPRIPHSSAASRSTARARLVFPYRLGP